jgi:phage shock protein E
MTNPWKLAVLVVVVAGLVVWMVLRGRGDISSEEAKEWVANGAVLVDVRTPGEYADGHIEGAVNIPLADLRERAQELSGKRVVLYCRSGNRSHTAQQLLRERGASEPRNLGAMSRW